MSDRCSMWLSSRRRSTAAAFARMSGYEWEERDGLYHVHAEEVDGSDLIDSLRKLLALGCVFRGGHSGGDEYWAESFACDGRELVLVRRCDRWGATLVSVDDETGLPTVGDLDTVARYLRVLKRVEEDKGAGKKSRGRSRKVQV